MTLERSPDKQNALIDFVDPVLFSVLRLPPTRPSSIDFECVDTRKLRLTCCHTAARLFVLVSITTAVSLANTSYRETGFNSVLVLGKVESPYEGGQTPAQHWIKTVHTCIQKLHLVLRLWSGGRLLEHFQTPALYWINFRLQATAHPQLHNRMH